MLKYLAFSLTAMFLILGADYIGRNGWTPWLGIPLTAIWLGMFIRVCTELFKDSRR